MATLRYASGDDVRLGDLVDVNAGKGPRFRVVVIISSNAATVGFSAAEWAYLKEGVMLQDENTSALLHLDQLDHEQMLVERAVK